ncbi:MAG: AraC family transcriptional regulator ligand-binding domain-containing protein [Cellvibrionaceae bacterium]
MNMGIIPLIPSSSLIGMRELLFKYGLDPEQIATKTQCPREALTNPALLISTDVIYRFLQESIAATENPFLLLELANHQGWHILLPLLDAFSQAKTLHQLLTTMDSSLEQFTQVIYSYITEEKNGISFCYDIRQSLGIDDDESRNTMPIIELGMAISVVECQRLIGEHWRPHHTQFMHSAPKNRTSLEKVFGKNLHFNQDRNSIFISNEDCDTAIPKDWLRLRLSQSTQRHDSLESIPLTLQVDRSIRLIFTERCCTIDDIAHYFHIPSRTLQHRLKKEGTHYQAILDQIRIDLARYYLKSSNLSVTAIAERLHFSETAVFSRFFKNKMKLSPLRYRKTS